MIYLKIKYILFIFFAVLITGCGSAYDYSIHKPKIRYKPSINALDRLNKINMGKRYVWAEEGPYCFDCSGFTYFTYGTMGIKLPRVARDQFKKGIPISKSELQKGDLVFFGNRSRGVATHVGIYIGNGKFEHASTAKKRVVVSSLNKPYYKKHYLGARRYYNFYNNGGYYGVQSKQQTQQVYTVNRFKPTYKAPKVQELFKNTVVDDSKVVPDRIENESMF